MSADIFVNNGIASIAYQGEMPWHKMGQAFPGGIRTIDQALDGAGLRYQVGKVPLFLGDGSRVEDFYMNGRLAADGSLAAPFGVVGRTFENSQNERNAQIGQPLIDLGCTIETAGALGQGERAWMLFRLPDVNITPVPGDDIRGYFWLHWGHDGDHGIVGDPNEIRVLCRNTWRMALAAGVRSWVRLHHRSNVDQRIDDAAKLVAQVTKVMLANKQTYADMARKSLTPAQLRQFIEAAIPSEAAPDQHGNERVSAVVAKRRALIAQLASQGNGAAQANQFMKGDNVSLWGAVNAISEYVDHVRPAEATTPALALKANESALFGSNALLKASAMQLARQLVAA